MSSTASHSLRFGWSLDTHERPRSLIDLYALSRGDALGNQVSVKNLGKTYFA
jgi:hypothetical protein